MAKKKKSAQDEQPDFEQCLEELSGVVAKLESGELRLDEALGQYELGVKRLKACYSLLSSAERRIELVRDADADGKPATEPFNESGDPDMMESAAARSKKRTAANKGGKTPSSGPADDPSTLF